MPTYTPPQSVADNAQLALDKRQQMPPSQQGMTAVGLARANQLAKRQPVSIETIQRMVSYFARHEVDKQGSTWSDWGPGRQAWNGWGGDEGRAWSQSILQEYEKMQVKAGSRHSAADMQIIRAARKASQSIAGYMEQLGDDMQDDDDTEIKSYEIGEEFNTRQRMIVSALIEVTHEAGKFDTSAGANGAHYMPAEQNAFMAKGIYCEHCYFYQPDYQCAIVDAIIDPMALCKFWVIPQSEIMEAMAESEVIDMPVESRAEEIYKEPMEGDMLAVRAAADSVNLQFGDDSAYEINNPNDVKLAYQMRIADQDGPEGFDEFKADLIALAKRKGPDFVAALPKEWRDEMAKSVQDFARKLIGIVR